ncbi:MAG: SHOCT domain-containing protein [Nitrospirae bacterium]|nr:MAG: SHOCT domain-containing protein [Nitrospirota bacterium]
MTLRLIAFCMVGLGSMASIIACAGPEVFSRPVYEDPTIVVRLDSPLFRTPLSTVDHPATPFTLSAEDLHTVLQSIRIKREIDLLSYYILRKEATPEPAFTEDELTLLVPHVHAALAKARPGETAVFVLTRLDENGIPRVTSGGVFQLGDQLGVVLANVHTPATSEAKQAKIHEHPLRPLNEPTFVHLVAGPYQTIVRTDQERFSLPEPTPVPVLMVNVSALITKQSRSPEVRPAPTSDVLDSGPASERAPSPAEKLRQLKRWHDEGLITDEEYAKKKQELLDAF